MSALSAQTLYTPHKRMTGLAGVHVGGDLKVSPRRVLHRTLRPGDNGFGHVRTCPAPMSAPDVRPSPIYHSRPSSKGGLFHFTPMPARSGLNLKSNPMLVRAFHDSFERSADTDRYGRIVKQGNWNSRLALADRAYGLKPVDGIADPATVAARKPTPADAIPDALKKQARGAVPVADAGQAAKGGTSAGHTTIHNTFHVHPAPGHDERKIADAVHRKFNEATQSQYNDGIYA